MRAGLLQLQVGEDPGANLPVTLALAEEAVAGGAGFVLTPEATNMISADRALMAARLVGEGEDPTLTALRDFAARRGVWLLIGSLSLKTGDADGRYANRQFLITPSGAIAARYDKIHMFDVVLNGQSIAESAAFRPGAEAVVSQTPFGTLGHSVCYDLRFPQLYRRLALGGAAVLVVPAAFHPVTGPAHWEALLRARAIENGAYVLAPAQTGPHGPGRASHGHSLAISPWGAVLADGGIAPGVVFADLDLAEVAKARAAVPSLTHDREFSGP
jgi:predicted amidohydrolase